jgi:ATP-dependent DNA ligase
MDLRMLPLEERKLRLRKTIEGRDPQIQYTDHITGQAARFYQRVDEVRRA